MTPCKFSILGLTAPRHWLHYSDKVDKNVIKELYVRCNQSLPRLHIFSNSVDIPALKTDSFGQVLIEHKANKAVYDSVR